MIATRDRKRLAHDLAQLMEELCEPGLTLGRSTALRPEVDRLLETIRKSEEPSRARGDLSSTRA